MSMRQLWMGALAAGLSLALTAAGTAQEKAKKAAALKLPELSAAALAKIEAAVPDKADAVPKQPRKLLVFWDCKGFFHGDGIACGNKAIELMGQKTGAWTTDITRDCAALEPANLSKYDAVVLNNCTKIQLSPSQRQGLVDFVKGGKGLVAIHAATDNFYDFPEGAKLLGGLFVSHPWTDNGTWAFKLEEPSHPLLKAFAGKNFKLKTEVYQFKDPYSRAACRVLISVDLSDPVTNKVKGNRTDRDYAVAWIKNVGQGRVFYCSLGHGGNVFQEKAIDKFYLDGIQFALGDLPVDASPRP